jgi:hypothetical protein
MKTTIDMAKEAGFQVDQGALLRIYLENFAELVRADEREVCAKVCEDLEVWNMDDPGSSAAKVIRSRNNK